MSGSIDDRYAEALRALHSDPENIETMARLASMGERLGGSMAHEVAKHFAEKGFDPEDAEKFAIGYMFQSFRAYMDHLEREQIQKWSEMVCPAQNSADLMFFRQLRQRRTESNLDQMGVVGVWEEKIFKKITIKLEEGFHESVYNDFWKKTYFRIMIQKDVARELRYPSKILSKNIRCFNPGNLRVGAGFDIDFIASFSESLSTDTDFTVGVCIESATRKDIHGNSARQVRMGGNNSYTPFQEALPENAFPEHLQDSNGIDGYEQPVDEWIAESQDEGHLTQAATYCDADGNPLDINTVPEGTLLYLPNDNNDPPAPLGVKTTDPTHGFIGVTNGGVTPQMHGIYEVMESTENQITIENESEEENGREE